MGETVRNSNNNRERRIAAASHFAFTSVTLILVYRIRLISIALSASLQRSTLNVRDRDSFYMGNMLFNDLPIIVRSAKNGEDFHEELDLLLTNVVP